MRAERGRELAWLWLPVLVWMAAIFYGSSQQGLPSAPSGLLDLLIHKTAHVIEYTILGVLAARACYGTLKRGFAATGSLQPALLAIALGSLYALSDEVHQLFVPTRKGRPDDVILDAVAVSLGVTLLWLWRRLRSRRQG